VLPALIYNTLQLHVLYRIKGGAAFGTLEERGAACATTEKKWRCPGNYRIKEGAACGTSEEKGALNVTL
jgi:hypothetical protein